MRWGFAIGEISEDSVHSLTDKNPSPASWKNN